MSKTWNVTPSSTPSLATAESQAQPGDTILLTGAWKGVPLTPKVSGTQGAPITYKAAGAGATFDFAGLTAPMAQPLAQITGRSWLVLDGIRFTNSVYKTAPCANQGIVVRASQKVTIQNCFLSYMQMQLMGSSFCSIRWNDCREFVAVYVNGRPQTAGDMLALIGGSHDNTVQGNDMKYAGHSLIAVGNGFGGQNARNQIVGNKLSNPWYKCLILADDGAGTTVEQNFIDDANSVPTLYSTVPGQVGQLQTSSDAIQISGSNFVVRNNPSIANAVATYGVISLGGRWYVDANHPNGVLVESLGNQIYGNTIQGNRGAAVFSFVEFLSKQDVVAGRTQVPRITGNLIHDNVMAGNQGTPYSWNRSSYHSTVIYHSVSEAPQWKGLGGNQLYANQGFDPANAFLVDGVFPGGVNRHQVQSLQQFQASDPTNVKGNS